MIACLEGALRVKALDHVVVDVGGVGYQVLVSTQTLAGLPAEGQRAFLLCHTHVREDALQLFGFAEQRERDLFNMLIGVSGIGPKLALTILSGLAVEQLVEAIAAGDHRRLQGVPGVGKRTAERLVVDLRDRVAGIRVAATGDVSESAQLRDDETEVIDALVNLGYKRSRAERAVEKVAEPPKAAEEMLRAALAVINEQ